MKFWALADLHLNFGVPEKSMEVFGSGWKDYTKKISLHWKQLVLPEDVVLIPGDISWALKTSQAKKDLEWIDALPGKKILLKGNHDHWWTSKSKVEKDLPPSLTLIQNNSFVIEDVAIAGARLWDTEEYSFDPYITFLKNTREKPKTVDKEHDKLLFTKELGRLEMSLLSIPPGVSTKIAMTHYPPIGPNLEPSKASKLLEQFHVNYCAFGHLHNVQKNKLPFGKKNGVTYLFTAADYCDFCPQLVFEKKDS
ncbi:MAG: metallophosphoesterase [Chlamydiota bacterium]